MLRLLAALLPGLRSALRSRRDLLVEKDLVAKRQVLQREVAFRPKG